MATRRSIAAWTSSAPKSMCKRFLTRLASGTHELEPLEPAARCVATASVQPPAEGLRPPGGELPGLGAVDRHAAHGDAGHGASLARRRRRRPTPGLGSRD